MARRIAKRGSRFFRPPLYPLFIACIYGTLGYEPLAVRLLQAVLSAATCLVPFALARSAYGERAGLYAALLTACHPLFIFFSGLFMAETLLLLCTGLALWCVQRVVNQSNVLALLGLESYWGWAPCASPCSESGFLCFLSCFGERRQRIERAVWCIWPLFF